MSFLFYFLRFFLGAILFAAPSPHNVSAFNGSCAGHVANGPIFKTRNLIDALEFFHLAALEEATVNKRELRVLSIFGYSLIYGQLCYKGLAAQPEGDLEHFEISDEGRRAVALVREYYQNLWRITSRKQTMLRFESEPTKQPILSHRHALILSLLNRNSYLPEHKLSKMILGLTNEYRNSELIVLQTHGLIYRRSQEPQNPNAAWETMLTIQGEKALANIFRFYADDTFFGMASDTGPE